MSGCVLISPTPTEPSMDIDERPIHYDNSLSRCSKEDSEILKGVKLTEAEIRAELIKLNAELDEQNHQIKECKPFFVFSNIFKETNMGFQTLGITMSSNKNINK